MVAQATLSTPEVYAPIGVDLTRTHSTAQFKLGAVARGSFGQEYMYVLTSGTLSQGSLVAIDEAFTARGCTTAIAKTAGFPAWAQIAFATDVYGWVATKGSKLYGKQKDGTLADALLFTSTSVGIMSSDGSTGAPVQLAGVRNVALTSGAGAAYEICAVNPHFLPSYALFT